MSERDRFKIRSLSSIRAFYPESESSKKIASGESDRQSYTETKSTLEQSVILELKLRLFATGNNKKLHRS